MAEKKYESWELAIGDFYKFNKNKDKVSFRGEFLGKCVGQMSVSCR